MKPASPPKPKQVPPTVDSDDDFDYDALPKPPPRAPRNARAAAKKYVDISDDDGDDQGSSFVDE